MDILSQEIDKMKDNGDLYIKFDFTGLDLEKCDDLCREKECFMYILYKGEIIHRCNYCDKYNKATTINEYEETSKLLGYNPPTDPMLDYSDSYWYCSFCNEHNYFYDDCSVFKDYFNEGKIKYINFKQTNTIYIYNENAFEIETYKFSITKDDFLPTPLDHIEIDNKLISYLGSIMYADDNDFEYLDSCFKYEHVPSLLM